MAIPLLELELGLDDSKKRSSLSISTLSPSFSFSFSLISPSLLLLILLLLLLLRLLLLGDDNDRRSKAVLTSSLAVAGCKFRIPLPPKDNICNVCSTSTRFRRGKGILFVRLVCFVCSDSEKYFFTTPLSFSLSLSTVNLSKLLLLLLLVLLLLLLFLSRSAPVRKEASTNSRKESGCPLVCISGILTIISISPSKTLLSLPLPLLLLLLLILPVLPVLPSLVFLFFLY